MLYSCFSVLNFNIKDLWTSIKIKQINPKVHILVEMAYFCIKHSINLMQSIFNSMVDYDIKIV